MADSHISQAQLRPHQHSTSEGPSIPPQDAIMTDVQSTNLPPTSTASTTRISPPPISPPLPAPTYADFQFQFLQPPLSGPSAVLPLTKPKGAGAAALLARLSDAPLLPTEVLEDSPMETNAPIDYPQKVPASGGGAALLSRMSGFSTNPLLQTKAAVTKSPQRKGPPQSTLPLFPNGLDRTKEAAPGDGVPTKEIEASSSLATARPVTPPIVSDSPVPQPEPMTTPNVSQETAVSSNALSARTPSIDTNLSFSAGPLLEDFMDSPRLPPVVPELSSSSPIEPAELSPQVEPLNPILEITPPSAPSILQPNPFRGTRYQSPMPLDLLMMEVDAVQQDWAQHLEDLTKEKAETEAQAARDLQLRQQAEKERAEQEELAKQQMQHELEQRRLQEQSLFQKPPGHQDERIPVEESLAPEAAPGPEESSTAPQDLRGLGISNLKRPRDEEPSEASAEKNKRKELALSKTKSIQAKARARDAYLALRARGAVEFNPAFAPLPAPPLSIKSRATPSPKKRKISADLGKATPGSVPMKASPSFAGTSSPMVLSTSTHSSSSRQAAPPIAVLPVEKTPPLTSVPSATRKPHSSSSGAPASANLERSPVVKQEAPPENLWSSGSTAAPNPSSRQRVATAPPTVTPRNPPTDINNPAQPLVKSELPLSPVAPSRPTQVQRDTVLPSATSAINTPHSPPVPQPRSATSQAIIGHPASDANPSGRSTAPQHAPTRHPDPRLTRPEASIPTPGEEASTSTGSAAYSEARHNQAPPRPEIGPRATHPVPVRPDVRSQLGPPPVARPAARVPTPPTRSRPHSPPARNIPSAFRELPRPLTLGAVTPPYPSPIDGSFPSQAVRSSVHRPDLRAEPINPNKVPDPRRPESEQRPASHLPPPVAAGFNHVEQVRQRPQEDPRKRVRSESSYHSERLDMSKRPRRDDEPPRFRADSYRQEDDYRVSERRREWEETPRSEWRENRWRDTDRYGYAEDPYDAKDSAPPERRPEYHHPPPPSSSSRHADIDRDRAERDPYHARDRAEVPYDDRIERTRASYYPTGSHHAPPTNQPPHSARPSPPLRREYSPELQTHSSRPSAMAMDHHMPREPRRDHEAWAAPSTRRSRSPPPGDISHRRLPSPERIHVRTAPRQTMAQIPSSREPVPRTDYRGSSTVQPTQKPAPSVDPRRAAQPERPPPPKAAPAAPQYGLHSPTPKTAPLSQRMTDSQNSHARAPIEKPPTSILDRVAPSQSLSNSFTRPRLERPPTTVEPVDRNAHSAGQTLAHRFSDVPRASFAARVGAGPAAPKPREPHRAKPGLLGCGTMGIAITSGILASLEQRSKAQPEPIAQGTSPSGISTPTNVSVSNAADAAIPSKFIACVSRHESARQLRRTFGDLGPAGQAIEVVVADNLKAIQESDVILLCCKPQQARTILSSPGIPEALDQKLLISILAGVTISQLEECVLPTTRVIRAMPNTPCRIREGMTVVTTVPHENVLDKEIILTIFSSIGRCRFLDEKHFDACTALSGSGPAFVCLVLEAMADGGVMMGLPRAEALELAAQTLQGTARMALQSGVHPAQIKDSVTTPAGCTIAGLLTLEDGRVRSTMARAIQVATQHAAALGQPNKGASSPGRTRISGYQTPHVVD